MEVNTFKSQTENMNLCLKFKINLHCLIILFTFCHVITVWFSNSIEGRNLTCVCSILIVLFFGEELVSFYHLQHYIKKQNLNTKCTIVFVKNHELSKCNAERSGASNSKKKIL